nr:DUF680 domain-containing protein [Mesorhizobium wenxiniae]
MVFAAVALATGSAFAGSDHYGSDRVNQPAAPVGPTISAPTTTYLRGRSARCSRLGRATAPRRSRRSPAPPNAAKRFGGGAKMCEDGFDTVMTRP